MGFKTYNRQMMADFTGRPLASFPEGFITNSAVPQALLLFKMGTCLASPDALNDDQKQLIDFAILSFADAIHLTAPYQAVKASPFNSESIGSYSYSKAAGAVTRGLETGVFWFDRAIQELSVCDVMDGIPMSSGIRVFNDEYQHVQHSQGIRRFLTPADMATSKRFGFDPATGAQPGVPIVISPAIEGPGGLDFIEDPDNPGLFIPVGD